MPEAPNPPIRAFWRRIASLAGDDPAARFTALAWLVMLALLVRQVLVYGTQVPFNDDWIMLAKLRPDEQFPAAWYWWVHNEHRIPLAKVAYVASVGGTHDIRAGTFVTVALLAASAWLTVRMARRLRGRAHFTDAFFPLLWMNGAQSENVLNSFQLAFSIPAAIAVIGLVLLATGDERPGPGRVAMLALVAWAMPLTGGIGLPHSVAWMGWFALVYFSARRSVAAVDRWTGRIAVAALLGTLVITIGYFVDYTFLPGFRRPPPGLLVETALQFLTRGVGETAVSLRATAPWVFAVLAVWALWLLARARTESDTSYARAVGISVVIVAMGGTALAVGYGRAMDGDGAGLLERYGMVAAPMWCALFAAACLAWSRRSGKLLAFVLFAISAASFLPNFRSGEREGTARRAKAEAFEADLVRGLSIDELAEKYWRDFYYSPDGFVLVLRDAEAARIGPFDRADR
ncbi:MAG: hypothetical protein JNL28_06025 [Planctomycetes bacterium]|nr:hypothetical protein [Planctomycetota bacterium]